LVTYNYRCEIKMNEIENGSHANPIEWDNYSLKINGKRIYILSGEFHYWRIPDHSRWEEILKGYKAAGLNAIRIYTHWGYHNPKEGIYHWDGNRDVNELLNICEKIGLYVFFTLGPYICAETNAGGFPLWLLAKKVESGKKQRYIRIKHMRKTILQKYDKDYMVYVKDWYDQLIAQIKEHQLSINPKGCLIGVQIENEYPEHIVVLTGSRRYMEELKHYALEFGITVPIFHNDVWENNAWNGVVDLYGFDKYVIWADKQPKVLPLKEWNVQEFNKKTNHSEKAIRKMGPPASETPLFMPELQGGWFNHWKVPYGYDELYDYYGSPYQKVLLQTMASQRVTMMSLYMFYGGTNYGTIANPEVYTSYDYSAAIREYNFQSDRFKHVRLFNLFVKSFNDSFSATEGLKKPTIKCNTSHILYKQRISVVDKTEYYFLRNFNLQGKEAFNLILADGTKTPKVDSIILKNKDGFIAIGNHIIDGFRIKFCGLPIITKAPYKDGTLIVCIQNGGELLLEGTGFKTHGYINVDEETKNETPFTRFNLVKEGFDSITSPEGKQLYIICLDEKSALTFNAFISQNNNSKEFDGVWGPYASYYDQTGNLEIETLDKQEIKLISCAEKVSNFNDLTGIHVPGIKFASFGEKVNNKPITLEKWQSLKKNWSGTPTLNEGGIWKPIEYKTERNPLLHGYMSGSILYKCEFDMNSPTEISKLILKLNTRNCAGVWLNGTFIGKQVNYHVGSVNFLKAGAMGGPDPNFLGSTKFDLTNALKINARNVLFVVTESLGQCKQFFPLNDCRNPRGILSAKFSQKLSNVQWYISSIDVRELKDPYNLSGFPGELINYHLGQGKDWITIDKLNLSPEDQLVWLKTSFKYDNLKNVRIPLRIHIEGQHNASIFLNGQYIGRYWGQEGPQHDFYLLDGYLKTENTIVLACWTGNIDEFRVEVLPYTIDSRSGNIQSGGTLFAVKRSQINKSEED
jgi:hypothetical protein